MKEEVYINKIDELLEIENVLLNLSNKMMEAELNGEKEELKKLNEYYSLSLLVENKKINELELNHDTFLEIVKYLDEKYNIKKNRIKSILTASPNLKALRIIYKLMTLGIENTNEEDLMNSFDEQRDILSSLYEHESTDISSNKDLFGSILLEQQLARTYLYNIENQVKDNKELMIAKHNLSYVYGYQVYEDKMTIIESNRYLNFFKTDVKTYNAVSKSYLKGMALELLISNISWNDEKHIPAGNKLSIKNTMLLKSIVFLLDDLSVRHLRKVARINNDESALNIIDLASEEKYDINNDNFKRR